MAFSGSRNDSDAGWIGIGLIALLALPVGLVLARPAYAVFTAFGLVGLADHFIDKWLQGGPPSPFDLLFLGVPDEEAWESALAFVGVGLALMTLALATRLWGDRWTDWIVTCPGLVVRRRRI